MSKDIDWSKAPEGATHAMTTGPDWDGASDLVGAVWFARLAGDSYMLLGEPGASFCVGDDAWVVAGERPA